MKSSLAIKNIFYCCSLYCLVIINILSSEADQQCSSMLLLTYEQYRVGELWSKVQSIRISSLTSTFIPQPFISCPVWIFSFWISHSVMWIADMYHYPPPPRNQMICSAQEQQCCLDLVSFYFGCVLTTHGSSRLQCRITWTSSPSEAATNSSQRLL